MKLTAKIGLAIGTALLAGCSGDGGASQEAPEQDTAAEVSPSPEPQPADDNAKEASTSASPAAEAAAAEKGSEKAPASPQVAQAAPVAAPPAFLQCRSCHSVEPGKNGVGPSLHGVYGKQAGSADGFNYSTALKESGITWNRASLDTWLTSPIKMVPGTRMVIGIPNEEARQSVIDYLETLK